MTTKTRSAATRPLRSLTAVKSRRATQQQHQDGDVDGHDRPAVRGQWVAAPSATAPTASTQARRLRCLSPPARTSMAPAANTAVAKIEPLTAAFRALEP